MKNTVLTVVLFVFSFAGSSSAQVAARLSGSVVDPTGLVVAGAAVDVLLPGGARPILSATSTAEGLFSFIAVPPGTYSVVVTAKGFRKATEDNVVLEAGA